ncbi:cystathionine gamma-synthase [Brevirhabdus pacifica]|uniref:Cystathionine gamma-synthase n=1 Tax=Brevirhabdus pacifica TaxID=1267768 RepID=A0A1U7DEY6_9RHOB|nr:aminotransferase class I/II-fold pyridoxal phosphate-dependent enzyme [Brevirhabdus pacifica]APX88570.1 cystathionine gamma-synthase [Brevirhabdus pacifica]PJJ86941.1 cystathionine gamma-synthase [Brevirhabdus pacifica]
MSGASDTPNSTRDAANALRRTAFPASSSRAVSSPIMPSVVYASATPDALDDQYEGRAKGFTYSREGHPNAEALARRIDMMEGVEGGIVTGSGMGAVTAMFMGLLKASDHVVAGNQLYGRSLRMLSDQLPRLGIEATLADPTDASAIEAALTDQTRLILVETVSNPTLRVPDLEAIAELARRRGVLLAVDNTFTTPLAYRALDAGADIVIHSITKLLSGHSDAMLGYVAARDPELMRAMEETAVTLGLTASPFDCWLAERGLLTFELRYRRACENAAKLADCLADLPGVRRVLYPGRSDHPDHQRAMALFGGQGGNMVSFEVEGGRAAANRLVAAAPDLPFAPTLGDVATTLSHPPSSSHRALTAERREALGISEGFFRVSVGIEEADQLCEELRRAVAAAAG